MFPELGNPGIDVEHYLIDLDYHPASGRLTGAVRVEMVLTEARGEITLDSVGNEVHSVTVDGAPVPFEIDTPELRIDLPGEPVAGERIAVEVEYERDVGVDSSSDGIGLGWFTTDDGSFVLVEPDGLRNVLPCNDHPTDKASFTFDLTVPEGVVAVANGELVAREDNGEHSSFRWEQRRPMATYLVQVLTGDYVIIDEVGPGGVPLTSVVLRADRNRIDAALEMTHHQLEFFAEVLGPYPLDRYGIAVTDSFAGLAMETQERSLFSRDDLLGPNPPGELLAHELAHQWFGNAVTLERWSDIWLNESFATYASWLWNEYVGEGSVAGRALDSLEARGSGSTAAPSENTLFGYNSYDGGAVVLHALRLEVGDDAFFTVLRRWVSDNNGTSQGTEDFIALAEDVSSRDLDEFFDEWLFATELPEVFPPGEAEPPAVE